MKQNVMKRTLAGVLAVLTVAAYMPANVGGFLTESTGIVMGVSAEEATSVSTAEELKNAVEAGGAVQLTANIDLTETLNVTEDVTIDLNGHNITAVGYRAFHVKSGTLTLSGSGTVSSTHTDGDELGESSSVIRVGNGSATTKDGSTPAGLYVGKNVTISTAWCYGVTVFGSSTTETVDVYGTVSVTGEECAVSGNGNPQNSGTTINIYPGAEVTATGDVAIYHPQAGTLNITGGRIEGLGGIEAKAGTAAISIKGSDTSIIATAEETSHKANGNGTSTRGYAIAAVENAGYAGSPQINVSGGNIVGPVELVKDNAVADEKKGAISITGGTFNTDVSAYVAEGYEVYQSGNSYTVSTEAVASIGEVRYPSLQAAIDAAQAGDTIELKKDVELSKTIVITKDVTIYSVGTKYITATNVRAFWVKSGKLTLSGMCKVKSTGSELDPDSSVIRVGSNDVPAGSTAALDIASDGVTVSSDKCYGVSVFGNKTTETVDVHGAIIADGSNRNAISGNGSSGYGGTTINVYPGANISAGTGDAAIYHPQSGTLNITGGTISGKSGIEAKAGTVNISGDPKIIATGAVKDPTNNGNGTSTSGYAIAAVENNKGYAGSPTFNVSDGTYTGAVGVVIDNVVPADKKGAITITGGTFNTELDAAYIAEGYAQNKDTKKVEKIQAEARHFTITTYFAENDPVNSVIYPDYYVSGDYTLPKAVYLDGYEFVGWQIFKYGDVWDTKSADTSAEAAQSWVDGYVSAGEDFTVKLAYAPKADINWLDVEAGSIVGSKTPASGQYQASTLIKVKADPAASDMKFSHWLRKDGNGDWTIVSYNETYSFYMPSNSVGLKAEYIKKETTVEEKATAVIESVTTPSNGKVAFVSVVNVPNNCTFVKGGLVATSDSTIGANVTAENAAYVKLSTKANAKTKNLKYTWTKSGVTSNTYWYVRGYAVYKDSKGIEHTVYSTAVCANIYGIVNQ